MKTMSKQAFDLKNVMDLLDIRDKHMTRVNVQKLGFLSYYFCFNVKRLT